MIPGIQHDGSKTPKFWSVDRAHAALQVDISIYSVDALLRAAYKFTDRCFFLMSSEEGSPNRCTVFIGTKSPEGDVDPLLADFVNELLDQRIRERLEEQFGAVRALIVAQAFSEGNLLDPQAESCDYKNDPKDIAGTR